jgi:hypothetical protein
VSETIVHHARSCDLAREILHPLTWDAAVSPSMNLRAQLVLQTMVPDTNFFSYPSTMGPGHNVVLFDPHGATPEDVSHRRIEGLSFTSRDLGHYEPPH